MIPGGRISKVRLELSAAPTRGLWNKKKFYSTTPYSYVGLRSATCATRSSRVTQSDGFFFFFNTQVQTPVTLGFWSESCHRRPVVQPLFFFFQPWSGWCHDFVGRKKEAEQEREKNFASCRRQHPSVVETKSSPSLFEFREKKWNMFPPGLEPRTFRVLGERDNHYTTETKLTKIEDHSVQLSVESTFDLHENSRTGRRDYYV